jgi:hypothetical protein
MLGKEDRKKKLTRESSMHSSIQAAPSCWGSAARDAAASNEVR